MGKKIYVHILTFCRNVELFYGTQLVFKTLRIGFPNADITVVDNASLPTARVEIKAMAQETGCRFEQIESHCIQHYEFIQNTIRKAANDTTVNGPLIFIDPDVCFWSSCEDFEFDGLMAGFYNASQCQESIRHFSGFPIPGNYSATYGKQRRYILISNPSDTFLLLWTTFGTVTTQGQAFFQ